MRLLQGLAQDLSKLARIGRDLPRFLTRPVDVHSAATAVRWRLEHREALFLHQLRRQVHQRPDSPYANLFRMAGCEPGDLEKMLTSDGLESSLRRLAREGVYLTVDEFKGTTEIVRGSLRMWVTEDDFDSHGLLPHVEARSGGTRGPPTSVKITLPYIRDLAGTTLLALRANGMTDYDHAAWLQVSTSGLIAAGLGHFPLAWFHPVRPMDRRSRLAAAYISAVSGLAGRRVPEPVFLDLRDPRRLVNWLHARRQESSGVCLTTYASSAVRVCLAAREAGISLDGVSFITLGEPFTQAKRQAIELAGARALVRYAFTEAGIIGFGCGQPSDSDDLHLFRDSYGVVQRRRAIAGTGIEVDALLYTSLLPTAPKILINVESGDRGTIETRDCECEMGAIGLRDHIRRIRSFEKLSGEGMTFVASDLLRALEVALPERFGGSGADYQLVEREGEHGILRLFLYVAPRVGNIEEPALRDAFLSEIGLIGDAEREGARIWDRARSVEIIRQAPLATGAGKILPFHLAQGDR